jgi:hypothetical protein
MFGPVVGLGGQFRKLGVRARGLARQHGWDVVGAGWNFQYFGRKEAGFGGMDAAGFLSEGETKKGRPWATL